jgi:hypothetical protein
MTMIEVSETTWYCDHHRAIRKLKGPPGSHCPTCGRKARLQLSLLDPEGPNVYLRQAYSGSWTVARVQELPVSDDSNDYTYECGSCNNRRRREYRRVNDATRSR